MEKNEPVEWESVYQKMSDVLNNTRNAVWRTVELCTSTAITVSTPEACNNVATQTVASLCSTFGISSCAKARYGNWQEWCLLLSFLRLVREGLFLF